MAFDKDHQLPLPPCQVCDSKDADAPAQTIIPCCDETCLDTIADRECALKCGGDVTVCCSDNSGKAEPRSDIHQPLTTLSPSPSHTNKRKRAACADHAHKVRKNFTHVLRRAGCICRELLALDMEPCCRRMLPASSTGSTASLPPTRSFGLVARERLTAKRDGQGTRIAGKRSSDSKDVDEKSAVCTETTENKTCIENPNRAALAEGDDCCGSASCDSSKEQKCRSGIVEVSIRPSKACCDELRQTSCGNKSDEDDCCGSRASGPKVPSIGLAPPAQPDDNKTTDVDVEKGFLTVEHVSLSVEGLTCVGCETKLSRALHDIRGIHNLHTSLILSKAEFDLDDTADPVHDVISIVEKSTGFACKRSNLDGQELDVVVQGDFRAFIEQSYPNGITEIRALDKNIVRITFDPRLIGARTVLHNVFEAELTLALPRKSSDLESGQKHVNNTAMVTLLSAILTVPVLILAWAPLAPRPVVYGATSLALATAVQFVIAGQFYVSALRALIFTRVIEMDLLIVLSTSTAYVFSIIAFAYQVTNHPLPTGEFFETSTLLVTLIMLGRLVSAFARQKAVESVSIRSLQSQTAVLCDVDGRNEQDIDIRLLQFGDTFKVGPDSRITTDGIIVTGSTEVDESMVTGESLPVDKHPGSSVVAGSINGSSVVVVRLTNLPGHNTISKIAAMVDEAKFQKPKTQKVVDKVASWFVPVILALTTITFVIWIAVGIAVRHQSAGPAVVNAITYAVSVLIISCPCAIGLCIPMVIVIGGGAAAKHGVIFKSAIAFETARKVSHVVFDKTGTLTEGELSVAEEVILADGHLPMSIALGLTSDSKHPVSAAISTYLKSKGVEALDVREVRSLTGKGVEGTYDGEMVRCGNTRWLSFQGLPEVQNLLGRGLTVFGVAIEDKPLAVYGLSDRIRPESRLVLTELKKRNIAISIVSGDDAGATEKLATSLDIPLSNVRSQCKPVDKQKYMTMLSEDKHECTLFCGDGTNDAVALAQADIGVHMSSGSEMAQAAAGVVLVRPSLTGVLLSLDLSRSAMHRAFLNFAWSFVYNLFAILLAAGAFVNARIPPQYAGLGEIVSVLPVILVALQLRWFKRRY